MFCMTNCEDVYKINLTRIACMIEHQLRNLTLLHLSVPISHEHDRGLMTVSSVVGPGSSCLFSPCLPMQFLRTFSATIFFLSLAGTG